MKVPFSWLQSFFTSRLDLVNVSKSLTSAGLEVDDIEQPVPFGEGFVVGKVLEVEKHPNADRLSVCVVATSAKEKQTIVCGAPNVAKGQTVAVVLPGARLPNGQEISKAEIRGVVSHGMICASDELGLGGSHEGILELEKTYKPGTKLDTVGLQDELLDVEVTPNRPDWLSVRGVAREVGVLLKLKMKELAEEVKELSPQLSAQRTVSVTGSTALQYHLRGFFDVASTKTPDWIISRLHAYGVESVHPVVDITNYVLYEYGQPLHAFDAKKIKGKRITVRFAKPKETLELLDGQTVTLTADDIVIADASGAIALAGVMGGTSTAVTAETTEVLLESAIFPSAHIRKTSRRLGVRTDAANRFERGLTPDLPKDALNRAAFLIQQVTGAKANRGIVSAKVKPVRKKAFTVSLKRINELLGTEISMSDAVEILKRLSFGVKKKNNDSLSVTTPVFRVDVNHEADVAEELARISGYASLKRTVPRVEMRPSVHDPIIDFAQHTRTAFAKMGYAEVLLPSFYGETKLPFATLPRDAHRTVANPLDSEQQYLRSDLLPGMLSVATALRKQRASCKLFEIGQVFWKSMRPGEHEWRVAWIASFQDGGEFIEVQQDLATFLSQVLHVQERDVHIGKGANVRDIKVDSTPVGLIALRPLKKGMTAACIECSLTELLALKKKHTYTPISKFPSVYRDIAVVVPNTIDVFTLKRQLLHASEFVVNAELFDVHPQSEATVSYAFHLEFSDPSRTLESREIEAHMTAIERALQEKGGVIRS